MTTLIEQDTPVKSIMKTTGHADERTFRRYNQRLREDQHRDVTRIFDEAETPRLDLTLDKGKQAGTDQEPCLAKGYSERLFSEQNKLEYLLRYPGSLFSHHAWHLVRDLVLFAGGVGWSGRGLSKIHFEARGDRHRDAVAVVDAPVEQRIRRRLLVAYNHDVVGPWLDQQRADYLTTIIF